MKTVLYVNYYSSPVSMRYLDGVFRYAHEAKWNVQIIDDKANEDTIDGTGTFKVRRAAVTFTVPQIKGGSPTVATAGTRVARADAQMRMPYGRRSPDWRGEGVSDAGGRQEGVSRQRSESLCP